jgi:hypothetical protein
MRTAEVDSPGAPGADALQRRPARAATLVITATLSHVEGGADLRLDHPCSTRRRVERTRPAKLIAGRSVDVERAEAVS